MFKVTQIGDKAQAHRPKLFSTFGKRILAEGLALVVSVSIITGCATSLKNYSSLNNSYYMAEKNNPKPIPIPEELEIKVFYGKFDVELFAVAPNGVTAYFGKDGKGEKKLLLLYPEGLYKAYHTRTNKAKHLEFRWDPDSGKFYHLYEVEGEKGKRYREYIPIKYEED